MKKRNILVIILILLIMICVIGYIFTLANNGSEMNNASYNNSTNPQLNKSVDKNTSLNNTALSNDENSVNDNLNNKYYAPSSSNNRENKNDSNDTNDSYDEAMEAKKAVERNVLYKNEIAGYPVYKHPRLDSWLVPIFDKKTKKFISSVYVHVGPEGNYYVSGPQFYSKYKDIISGKTTHKVDNNEYKSDVVEEVPDYSMRYVLAASNRDVSNNSDFMISDQVVLDNGIFLEENQLMPVMESDYELNSTS